MNSILMAAHKKLQAVQAENAAPETTPSPARPASRALSFDDVKGEEAFVDLSTLDIQECVAAWYGAGEIVSGEFHPTSNHSMSVNLQSGLWHDFDGSGGGKGMVSLYAHIQGIECAEARRDLSEQVRNGELTVLQQPPKVHVEAVPEWTPIVPVPDDAPAVDEFLPAGSTVYTYRDTEGRDMLHVVRSADRKAMPMTYCENADGIREWRYKGITGATRPLFGLSRLSRDPDVDVLICEGEKTATAAHKLLDDYVAVAWLGGANAAAKVNVEPLRARNVTLWPDFDKHDGKALDEQPGLIAMVTLAEKLRGVAKSVTLVGYDLADERFKDGWDLADCEDIGWTADDARAYMSGHRAGLAELREVVEVPRHVETKTPQKPRRTSLNLVMADALPDEYEAPVQLVEGLLTVGGGSLLYGDSNSGKTFFAVDLACAVARGEPWMDRRVRNGLVIYVASESPQSIRSRLQAYRQYHECAVPIFAIVQAPVNLWQSDEDADLLVSEIRKVEDATGQKAALIIGDTLARMSAGANENAGEAMGLVVERFDRIRRETGAHFMLIHHSGKDSSKGARGHSSLRAAVDTEIEVRDEGTGRYASVTKQRDLPGKGNRIGFDLHAIEIGTNQWGDSDTACVVLPADAPAKLPKGKTFGAIEAKVIAAIESEPGISRADLRAPIEVVHPGKGVLNAIAKLIREGEIEDREGGIFRLLPTLAGA